MKRISPATVTFGVMAIVLGLVAAYIVRQAMQKPPLAKVEPPPPDRGVQVVIARRNIFSNSQLTADDMTLAYAPRTSKAATGGVPSIAFASGRIVTKSLKAGQVVREEFLLGVGEGLPDLADRLPAGHQAVAITVEGADPGNRRLEEGDRIDIALTVTGEHPDLGEVKTQTLLRDVLVVDGRGEDGRTMASRRIRNASLSDQREEAVITVAVTPADANKLIVAEQTGRLSVALRSKLGPPPSDDDSITRKQLLGLREIAPPPEPEKPVPPPAPRKFTVEKWSGGSVKIIEMSEDRVRESREMNLSRPTSAPAESRTPTAAAGSFTGVIVP